MLRGGAVRSGSLGVGRQSLHPIVSSGEHVLCCKPNRLCWFDEGQVLRSSLRAQLSFIVHCHLLLEGSIAVRDVLQESFWQLISRDCHREMRN